MSEKPELVHLDLSLENGRVTYVHGSDELIFKHCVGKDWFPYSQMNDWQTIFIAHGRYPIIN